MRRLGLHQIDAAAQPNGQMPVTSGGVLVFATAPTSTLRQPLTTAIGGAPEDVWDANDERVLTEVAT